jgi:hypothetical protein
MIKIDGQIRGGGCRLQFTENSGKGLVNLLEEAGTL